MEMRSNRIAEALKVKAPLSKLWRMSSEPPELPPEFPYAEPAAEGRPWGVWATIGWSLLIVVGSLAAQIVVAIIAAVITTARGGKIDAGSFHSDWNILAMATSASGLVALALTVFFAWLRKGIDLKTYLALRLPTTKEFLRWFILLLLLILASDGLSALLDRPIVPEFMIEAYENSDWARAFLWLAVLVTAPLSEEFFFRGFLFTSLQQSRLGLVGTVLITSVLWAAIHLQYDLYGMTIIFLSGLILGFARAKTSSLWLCVMLHALMNLIATAELLAYLSAGEK